MMRRSLPTLFALATLALTATAAMAERKLAFVAGINAYSNLPEAQQLQRAVADATAVAAKLRSMGYRVTEVTKNVTRNQFFRRFTDFKLAIEPGDTAVVFYAGHGVAFGGGNFLLPADVPEPVGGDERLVKNSSIAETDLIEDIRERGARVTVMIIDACRDNPFPKTGTRSVGATRGLSVKEPSEGVLSIYSAGAGQKALDRLSNDATGSKSDTDPNSVFTRVLLREIDRPGQNLIDLGEALRDEVSTLAKSVQHAQVPAVYNQIIGARRVFLGSPTALASPVPLIPQPKSAIVAEPETPARQAALPIKPESATEAAKATLQAPAAKIAAAAVPSVSPTGNYVVQVETGANNKPDARTSYKVMQKTYKDILSSYSPGSLSRDEEDKSSSYSVQIGPFSEYEEAEQLCERLKQKDVDCYTGMLRD